MLDIKKITDDLLKQDDFVTLWERKLAIDADTDCQLTMPGGGPTVGNAESFTHAFDVDKWCKNWIELFITLYNGNFKNTTYITNIQQEALENKLKSILFIAHVAAGFFNAFIHKHVLYFNNATHLFNLGTAINKIGMVDYVLSNTASLNSLVVRLTTGELFTIDVYSNLNADATDKFDTDNLPLLVRAAVWKKEIGINAIKFIQKQTKITEFDKYFIDELLEEIGKN